MSTTSGVEHIAYAISSGALRTPYMLVVLIPIAVIGLFVVVAMLTMVTVMIMGLWLAIIYGSFSFLGFLFGLFFA